MKKCNIKVQSMNKKYLKLNILLFLIYFSFSLFSQVIPYKIDLSNKVILNDDERLIKGSKFFNSLQMCQLSNELGPIGRINKVIPYKEKLIIVDNQIERRAAIFVFNTKGEGLLKIQSVGRGPGQYGRIRDVSIDNKILYIYDDLGQKLLSYNIKDGHLLNERKITLPIFSFEVCNGYTYSMMWPGSSDHWLHIEDMQNNIVAKFLPLKTHPIHENSLKSYPFFKRNGMLLFCQSNIDTIFQLNGTQMKPYIIMNNFKLKSGNSTKNEIEKGFNIPLNKGYTRFYENSDFFCFQFNKDGQNPYYQIYDKYRRISTIQKWFYHDIINLTTLSSMVGDGENLIIWRSADEFIKYNRMVNESLLAVSDVNFTKIVDNINPLGNPIIFIFSKR